MPVKGNLMEMVRLKGGGPRDGEECLVSVTSMELTEAICAKERMEHVYERADAKTFRYIGIRMLEPRP